MSKVEQRLLEKLEAAWSQFQAYMKWHGSTSWSEYRERAKLAQEQLRDLVELAEATSLPVKVYRDAVDRMVPWN